MIPIVKFENKLDFMKSRMMLKIEKPGLYRNECLTKPGIRLFAIIRRMKCKKSFMHTWTNTGVIFVKKLNGEIKKFVFNEMFNNLYDNL